MATGQTVIEIRQLHTLPEFEQVLHLQQTIWGFSEIELLPVRFLVVVSKIGGHVFGAYHGTQMVAFCFAIPGIKPSGTSYLHSHMLGVLPEYHNAGIGRSLKLRQREDAMARGIQLIEWTFDPMELKNAFLNIEKLGAIVRRYSENQYGTTASPLHGGLPTDRCYAEWWISTPRVERILARDSREIQPVERISYPADIARIRRDNPAEARAIQKASGERFRDAFSRGLAATGFERGEKAGTYLLEPWS